MQSNLMSSAAAAVAAAANNTNPSTINNNTSPNPNMMPTTSANSPNNTNNPNTASSRAALLALVEEHLTLLVREAVSVQRHCKRARAVTAVAGAVDEALVSVTVGSAAAAVTTTTQVRSRLHAADLNMALRLLGSEKLYLASTPMIMPTPTPLSNIGYGYDPTVGKKRQKISLSDFLRQEELPLPPSEVGVSMHWLAVDGVQPQIPQNPNSTNTTTSTTLLLFDNAAGTAGATAATAPDDTSTLQVHQLQSSLLSEELQLYFSRVTRVLSATSTTTTAARLQQQDSVLRSIGQDAGLQELVPFLVRYCQQELYKHISGGSIGGGTGTGAGNTEHCRTLVRMARGLLGNPHLHLELHLHELLPALMTCIVAKRLGGGTGAVVATTTPTSSTTATPAVIQNNNHWALRREAAAAIVQACAVFGGEYTTLKARILRALCNAISTSSFLVETTTSTASTGTNENNENANTTTNSTTTTTTINASSLPSLYGGTVAISLFGAKAVDAFLLPHLLDTWRQWDDALFGSSSSSSNVMLCLDEATRFAIQMCQRATLDALGVYWQGTAPLDKAARLKFDQVVDALSDKWVVWQPQQGSGIGSIVVVVGSGGGGECEYSEYATCFV